VNNLSQEVKTMKIQKFFALSLITLMVFGAFSISQDALAGSKNASTFYVNDPMNRNSVTFKSIALLEDIVGITNSITGFLVFDPKNPSEGGHGELLVPVSTLNTGIPLRDEHLRSKGWLNAEKYPDIKLVVEKILNIEQTKYSDNTNTYDLHIIGKLSINGQTNTVKFPGRITFLKETEMTKKKMEGDLLAVRASFEINLADYNVTGPPGMDIIGSKVGESITIDVNLMGNTKPPAAANY
jgi:polyisoprenoid-binding protein YceI